MGSNPEELKAMRRILKNALIHALAALVILTASLQTARASDFKREVVYQIITDRFFDGSTANNKTGGTTKTTPAFLTVSGASFTAANTA